MNIVDILNQEISYLYAAAIQYNTHGSVISGKGWMGVSSILLEHAIEDFEQAKELANQVDFYGGVPTSEVATIDPIGTNKEMLDSNIKLAENALERYKQRVADFTELNEPALIQLFLEMAAHEQEELAELEGFVCEDEEEKHNKKNVDLDDPEDDGDEEEEERRKSFIDGLNKLETKENKEILDAVRLVFDSLS